MAGAEPARRLEVDIRIVRNYILTLAERERYGVYFLRPGYKLPLLIFTEDESLALTLSPLVAREHGLAQTPPVLAIWDICLENVCIENTSPSLLVRKHEISIQSQGSTMLLCSAYSLPGKGEALSVSRVLQYIKQGIYFCSHLLQQCFLRWTQPPRSSLLLG